MTAQTLEKIKMFSEAELEYLQFLPEELEEIESEQYPDLENISLEAVAKDLEAYFEEDFEEEDLEDSELERLGFLKRIFKSGKRKTRRPRNRRSRRRRIGRGLKKGFRGFSTVSDLAFLYQTFSGGQ